MQIAEHIDHLDHTPKYNVKAVSQLVGLSPVTLRAWERRYGLPSPQRGTQGYRLYSDYDVRTLRWLKLQTEAGWSISRAAQQLGSLRVAGKDPAIAPREHIDQNPASLENLMRRCVYAWSAFDEQGAAEALRLAFSLYTIDQVLLEVITPALVELGERWHRGELPVATEHFATQFCLRHMLSMLASAGTPHRTGAIIAACAPGEYHEIGLLIMVLLLRWRGWDVKYLGPNLALAGFEIALKALRPNVLLFTATRPEAAEALLALPVVLHSLPAPHPTIVIGGQGFSEAHAEALQALYLQTPPMEAIATIEQLLLIEKKPL